DAAAPQLKERNFGIAVRRGEATIKTYQPADIDGEFVHDWYTKAQKLEHWMRAGNEKDASKVAKGAQILIVMGASEAAKSAAQKAIDLLNGAFAKKNFVVMEAGPLAKTDVGQGDIVLGSDLGAKLKKAQDDFAAQATKETAQKEKEKADADAAAAKEADDAKA